MHRRTASLTLSLALVAWGSEALADEGEWVLAVEPTWALLSTPDGVTRHGGGGILSAWAGLTPLVWLSATAGATVFPEDEGPTAVEAAGGLVLTLDVFRVVPFFDAALGAQTVGGDLAPFVRIGLGADYLLSRTVGVGVVGRVRAIFQDASSAPVQVGLRLSFRGEL